MNVILTKENADGSAVFTFDMTPEETRSMLILGLKTAILAAIEDAKGWDGSSDLEGLQGEHVGVPV